MAKIEKNDESKSSARYASIASLTIRTKLAIIVVLGFITTFSVTFVLIAIENKEFGLELQEKRDLLVADLLVGQMESAVEFKDGEGLARILGPAIQSDKLLKWVEVTHVSGQRLAGFGQDWDAPIQVQENMAEAATSKLPQLLHIGNLFIVSHPVIASEGTNVVGIASFVWDTSIVIRAQEAQVYWVLLLGCIVALCGLVLVIGAVSRLVTTPISELTKSMTLVAARDYETPIGSASREDEIGSMASTLEVFQNELANEERERQKRRVETALRQNLLQELGHQMSLLAEGQTDCKVNVDDFVGLDDDHKEICANFNDVVNNLRRMLSTAMSTSESVRMSALEISRTAEKQSKRSETQAATLEESAGAIEDLNVSVQKTANIAADANMHISENKALAAAGGEIVDRTVKAMRDIEQSSQQITAIISVIDDIAFQTNLLALNAGVEAARAGEAGRGFAVVASEVRALAQRASESANEIKDLILRSGGHVREGSELANQAGTALSEIISGVAELSAMVELIASGSSEQAQNLSEIKESVSQLDRETQKNAAIIEEASAASQSLSNEAERMTDVIKQFTFETALDHEVLADDSTALGGSKNWSEEIHEMTRSEANMKNSLSASLAKDERLKIAGASEIDESWEEF